MSGRSIDTACSSASGNSHLINGHSPDGPKKIRIALDLVAAARRHVSFLRSPPLLHRRSVQRYEELWMPLIADLIDSSSLILPPADVWWIWHCHCLHDPARYHEYCLSRFRTVIERPVIFDEENEEYALLRCREIWEERYPQEPFDLEMDCADEVEGAEEGEIWDAVARYRGLPSYFSGIVVLETVYLVSAKQRYLDFLYLVRKFRGPRMVPTSNVMLMWLTHKSFPLSYGKDLNDFADLDKKIISFGDRPSETELDETKRMWEEVFDEPYERPGALINPVSSPARVFFNWEASYADANRIYKSLQRRLLMEVHIFLKGKWEGGGKSARKTFLRLRTERCNRLLKLDKYCSELSSESWRLTWHLCCEFSTRGVHLEVREKGGSCFRNSKLLNTVVFSWNDLLHITTFTLAREVDMQSRALASITPPVQAPYLLKCVPDRVTDDSGAMISEVILRMNRYRPQEGRWLTRTVLNHNGKDCFVVRIRVGKGIWRRGAENPSAVKWEDRVIEVREGAWSYVASSVGSAPEKVVGTANPSRDDSEEKKAIWSLSTGDHLTVQWENGPDFHLENDDSTEMVRLLSGRRLQYELKNDSSSAKATNEEQYYITLVRYSPEHPEGRATALLNWKLLAVEFLPEEDGVFVLLLCTCIALAMCEITREDVAGFLVRKRVREVWAGLRDWGSVLLPSSSSSSVSPHQQPWYWNAQQVLAPAESANSGEMIQRYLPSDGKDVLFKRAIIP